MNLSHHRKISLLIEISRNAWWNKSTTMLVSQIQYVAGQSGKRKRYCTMFIT